MIIGICGKSGSGKSYIADRVCELLSDYKVLNIDKVGHEVTDFDEVKKELAVAFGNEVIKENKVDRKLLGKIVFNNKNEMDKLTAITWAPMKKIIDNSIGESNIILDWLLLPNTEYFNRCDIKILVDIPYEVRLYRATTRDNITKEKFDEREKASIEYNPNDFDIIVTLEDQMNIDGLINNIVCIIRNCLERKNDHGG